MENKIIKALEKEIKANLPGLAAEQMKEFIAEAQQTSRELKSLEVTFQEQIDLNASLLNKLQELEKLELDAEELEVKRLELEGRENALAQSEQMLSLERNLLQANADNMHNLVSLVFKSPDAKNLSFNLSGCGSVPVTDNNGYTTSQSISANVDGKISEDADAQT